MIGAREGELDRRDSPGAVPVIACHDEIVVECDADQAEAVAAWLRQAMVEGMAPLIAPVPVVVEVSVGRSWAG
jgi:DNA polymerase I-like protein with 3'-5' exonuclease and polymerase domains